MNDSVIERPEYLNRLIEKKENGLVKIITGVRRCGKSFLLFVLYKQYLIDQGVSEDQIISLALDNALNAGYRDPTVLAGYLDEKTPEKNKTYYLFLDEIQFVGKKKISNNPEIFITLYDVLNTLLQKGNIDLYVTGSNSKMLSKDIATEFRGRGDEIYITPVTFKELYEHRGGDKAELFSEYLYYGGMPQLLREDDFEEKRKYLSTLFSETYLKDILERHLIEYPETMELIADELASAVGSLTNANKIACTLKTENNIKIDSETVGTYLRYLTESYLFAKADRYDVKGKKYFSYPSKYYCVDTGIRNAQLNFRQVEETHLMENIIYNELLARGHAVDVGVVELTESAEGRRKRTTAEIDFVVNADRPGERCYIQVALNTDTPVKMEQEIRPFMKLKNDFTKSIVITKTMLPSWTDDYGILHTGIYDFLLGKIL